jgi:hypothetical protein
VARENGLDEKVITACLLRDIAIAGPAPLIHDIAPGDDQRHLAEQLPVRLPAPRAELADPWSAGKHETGQSIGWART